MRLWFTCHPHLKRYWHFQGGYFSPLDFLKWNQSHFLFLPFRSPDLCVSHAHLYLHSPRGVSKPPVWIFSNSSPGLLNPGWAGWDFSLAVAMQGQAGLAEPKQSPVWQEDPALCGKMGCDWRSGACRALRQWLCWGSMGLTRAGQAEVSSGPDLRSSHSSTRSEPASGHYSSDGSPQWKWGFLS